MIGGQTLMTSTVEEKSSRVVEVLLSAVSPLELMAGKILGQMAVSLLVLALYVGDRPARCSPRSRCSACSTRC